MSTTTLKFMGEDEPEAFRCRIYGAPEEDEERQRRAFIRRLAGDGVLDAPAFDEWIGSLDRRGWLRFDMEPADGGYAKRWRLNEAGRDALREHLEAP